jgi:hypothetical protein
MFGVTSVAALSLSSLQLFRLAPRLSGSQALPNRPAPQRRLMGNNFAAGDGSSSRTDAKCAM